MLSLNRKKFRLVLPALLICFFGCLFLYNLFCDLSSSHKNPKVISLSKLEKPAVEYPFVILIYASNPGDNAARSLRSALEQQYKQFRVIYIDDHSEDGSYEKGKHFIENNDHDRRVQFIREDVKKGKTQSLYYAIHGCDDQEIIILLDARDSLAHEYVLNWLNRAYYEDPIAYCEDPIWMTYGGACLFPLFKHLGARKDIPDRVYQRNNFREYALSHSFTYRPLQSFYAGLFKQIRLEDFIKDNKFLNVWDYACMIPLAELAGKHVRFVKDVLYFRHANTRLSESKKQIQEEKETKSYMASLPSYEAFHDKRDFLRLNHSRAELTDSSENFENKPHKKH